MFENFGVGETGRLLQTLDREDRLRIASEIKPEPRCTPFDRTAGTEKEQSQENTNDSELHRRTSIVEPVISFPDTVVKGYWPCYGRDGPLHWRNT